MTPFMLVVQGVLEGDLPREPVAEPSRRRSVAVAADAYVNLRSRAEQLVGEANAVLRERGERISLIDDTGAGALAFTLCYRGRAAQVKTVVSGRTAMAQLVMPEAPGEAPCELGSGDELEALLMHLLADETARR